MTFKTGERLLITLLGLATLALGGWTAFEESAVNLRGGSTPMTKLLTMPDGTAPIGPSILAQTTALKNCEVAMRSDKSIEMMYLPVGTPARLNTICGELATGVTKRTPSMSLAWAVLAAVSARTGDMAEFNSDLVRSRLTAPYEYWLADIRVGIAETSMDALDDEARQGYERDLAVMAEDPYQVWTLARRYVADSSFRVPMQTGLQTAPAQVQAAFLDRVDLVLKSEGR